MRQTSLGQQGEQLAWAERKQETVWDGFLAWLALMVVYALVAVALW